MIVRRLETQARAVAQTAPFSLHLPDWYEDALCAQTDPEAFFPEKGGSTRNAKAMCLRCDVREQCLEAAIDRDERFGIWGAMSERDRRKEKKRREEAVA